MFSFLRDFFSLSEFVLLSQLVSPDNHGIEDCPAKVLKPHVRSVKDIHEDRRIQQQSSKSHAMAKAIRKAALVHNQV